MYGPSYRYRLYCKGDEPSVISVYAAYFGRNGDWSDGQPAASFNADSGANFRFCDKAYSGDVYAFVYSAVDGL